MAFQQASFNETSLAITSKHPRRSDPSTEALALCGYTGMLQLSPVPERTEEALSYSEATPQDSFDGRYLGPAEVQPAEEPPPQQAELILDGPSSAEPAQADEHPAEHPAEYADVQSEALVASGLELATAADSDSASQQEVTSTGNTALAGPVQADEHPADTAARYAEPQPQAHITSEWQPAMATEAAAPAEDLSTDQAAIAEPAQGDEDHAVSAESAEYHQKADTASESGPPTASHTEAAELGDLHAELQQDALQGAEQPQQLHSHHSTEEHVLEPSSADFASRRVSGRTSNGAVAGSTVGRRSTAGHSTVSRRLSDNHSQLATAGSARHSQDFSDAHELASSEQRYDFR